MSGPNHYCTLQCTITPTTFNGPSQTSSHPLLGFPTEISICIFMNQPNHPHRILNDRPVYPLSWLLMDHPINPHASYLALDLWTYICTYILLSYVTQAILDLVSVNSSIDQGSLHLTRGGQIMRNKLIITTTFTYHNKTQVFMMFHPNWFK